MGGVHDAATLTVAFALVVGVACSILGARVKISSLFFYLLFGIALGPSGVGLLQPYSLGDGLKSLVEIGVAIILFEGAVELDFKQIREMRNVIRNLLTSGVIITAIGGALAAYLIADVRWEVALLYGSLMTVTGPTVIRPILRRVPLKKPLGAILHWESVLIDPIGAILAVFVFELAVADRITAGMSVVALLKAIVTGGSVGVAFGMLYAESLKRRIWGGGEQRNIGAIATSLLIYAFAEYLSPHSGLTAVVAGGLIVGLRADREREGILRFKGALVTILLSTIFVLLSANLVVDNLISYASVHLLVVACMLFIVRPISVFLSTRGAPLAWNEKLFLAWISPRGIVAASMAALFAFSLQEAGWSDAIALESMVFLTIGVTVVLQGLPAGIIARLLRVRGAPQNGYLIVGAHDLGLEIAQWLMKHNIEVRLIDTDLSKVINARQRGMVAYYGNAIDEHDLERIDMQDIGRMLSCTGNDAVNIIACQLGARLLNRKNVFRPMEAHEISNHGVVARVGGERVFPGIPTLETILDAMHDERAHCSNEVLESPLIIGEESSDVNAKRFPLAYQHNGTVRLITNNMNVPKGADVLWLHICPSVSQSNTSDT